MVLRERKECLRKLREQQVAGLEEEAVSNWFVSQRHPTTTWTHLAVSKRQEEPRRRAEVRQRQGWRSKAG